MAQPTVTDVHVDQYLTNLSVAYMQARRNFIATRIFPKVPSDKKSNIFYKYNKEDWFRDEAQRRAPATPSVGSGYGLTTERYDADVWAIHKDIDSQTRANADSIINLDRDATEFVTTRLLLKQEKLWVSSFFQPGVWTAGDLDGDNADFVQWDDDLSDPIEDVEEGKQVILSTTGQEPNTLVLGYRAYRRARNHPDIIDRLKYTGQVTNRTVTEEMLAQMFGVDQVLVARAIENTAQEGATGAYDFVFGDHALLAYSAPSPGLLQASAGYTFVWTGVSAGLGEDIAISRFYMDEIKADRIEGEIAVDMHVIAPDMGYFLANVVS